MAKGQLGGTLKAREGLNFAEWPWGAHRLPVRGCAAEVLSCPSGGSLCGRGEGRAPETSAHRLRSTGLQSLSLSCPVCEQGLDFVPEAVSGSDVLRLSGLLQSFGFTT